MNWEVHISKSVKRRIRRFPKKDYERVLEVLDEFRIDPWRGNITKMEEKENLWRKRVGSYRVFYSIQTKFKPVEIKEIVRRTSSTY